jgi:hypothetical protein
MQAKQKIKDGEYSLSVTRTRMASIPQVTMNAHEGKERKMATTFDNRVQGVSMRFVNIECMVLDVV